MLLSSWTLAIILMLQNFYSYWRNETFKVMTMLVTGAGRSNTQSWRLLGSSSLAL